VTTAWNLADGWEAIAEQLPNAPALRHDGVLRPGSQCINRRSVTDGRQHVRAVRLTPFGWRSPTLTHRETSRRIATLPGSPARAAITRVRPAATPAAAPRQTEERIDSMSELGFDGKVAIITGSGGGLGRQHALMLAARGALVVVNDLGGAVDGSGSDAGAAQKVVEEITAAGGEAVADTNSVATVDGGAAIVQSAIDAFGRVDIVVNNAGILRDKSFANMTPDQVDAVIDVHLKGAFYVTQPAFVHMKAQGYGRIVSTASSSGLFGNFGQANYGAAKMGLVGFTRVLAVEGSKHNIRANAIAPLAATRMTQDLLGSVGAKLDPKFVAPLVTYLSHASCESTGRVYSVGGGRVAEVFIAEAPGFHDPELTPESLVENWAAVTDREGYAVPGSGPEETALYRPYLV